MTDFAMYALAAYGLPLAKMPTGFGWDDRISLETFTEETAGACVTARDTFRGSLCCVVCGEPLPQVCRIIAETKACFVCMSATTLLACEKHAAMANVSPSCSPLRRWLYPVLR